MTVLVTGATGYTGRYIVEALLAAGESARCLARPASDTERLRALGVPVVEGDLEDPGSLAHALEGVDAVLCASHIRFARHVSEACARVGVERALFFSSTWRSSKVATPEVSAVIEGETAVEESGLDATVLRPTMIYGPGEDRNISRLRHHLRVARVHPIFCGGEQLVQPVYVADVAQAAVTAIRSRCSIRKVYEIAGRDAIPYRQMIDTVCAAVGRTVIKVYIPSAIGLPLVRLYGMMSRAPRLSVDQVRRMAEDRAFDTTKAEEELAFAPRGFSEGLRDAMRDNEEEIDSAWERSF